MQTVFIPAKVTPVICKPSQALGGDGVSINHAQQRFGLGDSESTDTLQVSVARNKENVMVRIPSEIDKQLCQLRSDWANLNLDDIAERAIRALSIYDAEKSPPTYVGLYDTDKEYVSPVPSHRNVIKKLFDFMSNDTLNLQLGRIPRRLLKETAKRLGQSEDKTLSDAVNLLFQAHQQKIKNQKSQFIAYTVVSTPTFGPMRLNKIQPNANDTEIFMTDLEGLLNPG